LSQKLCIENWQSHFAKNGRIICWTIMERSTLRLLQSERVLSCPTIKASDDPVFQNAYAWMKASMTEAGLPAPASDISPWWCWIRRDEGHPEPYIEDVEGLDDPVVLELSLPSSLIVLSCFDLWHFALNRWYIWDSEADHVEFEHAWEVAQEEAVYLPSPDEKMFKSWSAIFELDQDRVDLGRLEAKSIQGCFWVLNSTT